MNERVEKEFTDRPAGVYPPTFCNWRLLLAVMVITEVSVVLVGLGPGGFPGWRWQWIPSELLRACYPGVGRRDEIAAVYSGESTLYDRWSDPIKPGASISMSWCSEGGAAELLGIKPMVYFLRAELADRQGTRYGL